ncbi:MAG: hypothetical protein JWM88_3065 [Verrucomicrobia bacterium]|nr:hypothetical protein [Verrucomicrobiota bacterium]
MTVVAQRLGEARAGPVVFAVCVILNLGFSFVGWRNNPVEVHEFRQVQTALTARAIQEEGWSLAYPMPLFGPPWSAPMEFPVYQLCVAKLATLTHLPIEPAARAVALAFLYLALPACGGLIGLLGVARPHRWLFLGLILLSPVYLYYSRAIMIESTAFCASAWFLLAYCRVVRNPHRGWLAAAGVFGILAALAKVTTLMVFLAVAATYTLSVLAQQWRAAPRDRRVVAGIVGRTLLTTLPAVIVGTAWVHFSDGIKRSNPLSAFLASGPMESFNFGTLAQRGSFEFWQRIGHHTAGSVVPVFNLTLILLFAVILDKAWRGRTLLLLGGYLAGPLVFSNLYFVHDYYFYANGAFLLGALAIGWDRLLAAPMFPTVGKWLVIAVSLGVQVLTYSQGYLPFQRAKQDGFELGRVLRAVTRPEDVVLIFGRDWDSKPAYFSHRRTIMITDVHALDLVAVNQVLDRLPDGSVGALVIEGKARASLARYQPLMRRLKVKPVPLLVGDDALVHVAEDRVAHAREQLERLSLDEFRFDSALEIGGLTFPRKRYVPSQHPEEQSLKAVMTPMPLVVMHPYGVAVHQLEGKSVFNAHAPTDVVFEIPPKATVAAVRFGMLPAAYGGKNATDGVEFRVEVVDPAGHHQVLRSIYLSPSKVEADRGEKSLEIPLPPGTKGEIWFRTLPGPTGSIAFAWAYWAGIELR